MVVWFLRRYIEFEVFLIFIKNKIKNARENCFPEKNRPK